MAAVDDLVASRSGCMDQDAVTHLPPGHDGLRDVHGALIIYRAETSFSPGMLSRRGRFGWRSPRPRNLSTKAVDVPIQQLDHLRARPRLRAHNRLIRHAVYQCKYDCCHDTCLQTIGK